MREITPQLTEALKRHFRDSVSRCDAFPVATYNDLMRMIAKLSYLNRDNLLFFRGQPKDYRNKAGASTLYPSLYRKNIVARSKLEYEFALLKALSALLVEETRKVDKKSADEIRRRQYIQWSLIQHYKVHETPLLDLTQSLRVACSFAQSRPKLAQAYVFVLGLPYLPNGISINPEQEIVNIRLLSVCPTLAMRPYFQEGFLAGTPDLTDNYDDKNELDFNRRLVAKFVIPNDDSFWENNAQRIPDSLLFPREDEDPMLRICSALREAVMKTEGMLFPPRSSGTEEDEEGGKTGDAADELAARLRRRLG
ncbi:MAG: FRG domain-containing protein [Spirochaetes bacterium]|nr:FRG domain-containing protein [Spirochaetota bacterium]